MALISPGIQVTVTDETNFLPAATNSVPFILIATAENKPSSSGPGIAPGTLASNANNTFLITSQRELVNTFGNPAFYTTATGTPLNGYELNEYGLLAAYSVLGISNRAYIQRANIDLGELIGTLTRPSGSPAAGAYWLDTSESVIGIFEWNAQTGLFSKKDPIVVDRDSDLDTVFVGGVESKVPKTSVGSIGDYAIVVVNSSNPVYYKNQQNEWVLVGSNEWKSSWPTVLGSVTSPIIETDLTLTINGEFINIAAAESLSQIVDAIDNAGVTGVSAQIVNGRLAFFADSSAASDGSSEDGAIDIFGTVLAVVGIEEGRYETIELQQSRHTQIPKWRTTDPRPTGSVWHKTTPVNLGTDLSLKQFDSESATFVQRNAPLFLSRAAANFELDPAAGGRNIPVNTVFALIDPSENGTFTLKLYRRSQEGTTIITGTQIDPTMEDGDQIEISVSQSGSSELTNPVLIEVTGTTAADFAANISAAGIPNITAAVTPTGQFQLTHTQGGIIKVTEVIGNPLSDVGITTDLVTVEQGNTVDDFWLSAWTALSYDAATSAPGQDPVNGQKWYWTAIDQIDIMVSDGQNWRGYRNVVEDIRGFNLSLTDSLGPIAAGSAPRTQRDGSDLVYGDLWVDTSDLENYPRIYRWEPVDNVDRWVLLDNSDQTTENGIVFADARWSNNNSTDPVVDPIIPISAMSVSDYLDLDAPSPLLYPEGTLLFNTRRSGYNVKEFRVNYFNAATFPGFIDQNPAAWVTAVGNRNDGSPYMGRKAVRQLIVQAMKSAVDTNTDIREDQRQFNLIAAPGYPELIDNMVALNNERRNTAFVIGDTPLRLTPDGNSILQWAAGQGDPADILTTSDPYMGVFYPSCQTFDLSNNSVVQPASHMMLRTFIRNDNVAFPWLAPAGQRRGTVDNARSLGYVDPVTGSFVPTGLRAGLRDTLYENRINPITFIPGAGITNFGNKTTQGIPSALDRINVARLVAFIRGRLELLAAGFLFEPNDTITRNEVKNAVESLLNDLVAKRGIYDYLVVCDESNNTPSRIDRNELYVDIAIEPVKAVEFIYIPVRIKNTGEIAAGTIPPSQAI